MSIGRLLDYVGILAAILFVLLVTREISDVVVASGRDALLIQVGGIVVAVILGIKLLRLLATRQKSDRPQSTARKKTNPLPLAAFVGIVFVLGQILRRVKS